MNNRPDKIIVHHSAFEQEASQLMQINQWHKERDFPLSSRGFYVGYHYVIDNAGNIVQTRELDEVGAHTRGFNFESIGVCLEGDFTKHTPTEAQKHALGNLLVMLVERLHIAPEDIFPHRTFGNTSCYGEFLMEDWARKIYYAHANLMNFNLSPCEAK